MSGLFTAAFLRQIGWECDVFLEAFERRTAYRGAMSTSSVPAA